MTSEVVASTNVLAAWGSGGFHYLSCGLQMSIFALPFPRGYCRHCAKPLVRRWHLSVSVREIIPIFGRVNFDVSVGIAPTRNMSIVRDPCRSLMSNVIYFHIHIRFYYTAFSTNAARHKRLIYSGTRS
jgi:hypothetical protein